MTAGRQFQHIFLLSHMRAFSSLIGHILGSHPSINGYYEMHLAYTRSANLDDQLRLYQEAESIKPGSRYLFDKLLHNDYSLDTTILEGSGDRILMSLRPPVQSLKSIIHLFQGKDTDELFADPAEATAYYIGRLEALAEFSAKNPGQYYYFDAELIKSHTDELLCALTRWCGLEPVLSSEYRTFSQTGKVQAGDSSTLIKSGKIQSSETSYPGINLDTELASRAEEAYAQCRSQILAGARESLAS